MFCPAWVRTEIPTRMRRSVSQKKRLPRREARKPPPEGMFGGLSVAYFHFQPMPALMPHSLPVVVTPAPHDILPSSDSALKVSATAL